MNNKNYKDALAQLNEFIAQREVLINTLEESIDKYIIDRTLPFDYKEKYVQWQQELLDVCQNQLKETREYIETIKDL